MKGLTIVPSSSFSTSVRPSGVTTLTGATSVSFFSSVASTGFSGAVVGFSAAVLASPSFLGVSLAFSASALAFSSLAFFLSAAFCLAVVLLAFIASSSALISLARSSLASSTPFSPKASYRKPSTSLRDSGVALSPR